MLVDVLDLLHSAARDGGLLRLGIPPAQAPTLDWLTDPVLRETYLHSVHPKYGLPTSPPTPVGPYVVQRFQRGLMRRWVDPPPVDLPGVVTRLNEDAPPVERLMVGDLLRSSAMIPPRALVADLVGDAHAHRPVPAIRRTNPRTDVVAHPLPASVTTRAGEDVKASLKPGVEPSSDLDGLMQGVVSGQHSVNHSLRAVHGEVAVQLDHGVAGENGVSTIDLDLIIVLGGEREGGKK